MVRILAIDQENDFRQELARVGADEICRSIFAHKHQAMAFKVDGLSTAGANILKQTALACGADCAVHHDVASGRAKHSDAILFVNRRQLPFMAERLRHQPECVARIVPRLLEVERRAFAADLKVRFGDRELDLGERTYVTGILNVTPDSFYDGGQYLDPAAAAERAAQMEEEGADFIDVGAESTRPGSEPVPDAGQVKRLVPVLKKVCSRAKALVSVDTTSATVARAALDAGAQMVNDVSGFTADPKLAEVVARAGVPCVLMHLPERPATMQQDPVYDDLMAELVERLDQALERGEQAGVERSRMIVDPGIGFGKTLAHNLQILRRLSELATLGRPIMIGTSRKSFIAKALGLEPDERLEATLASCVVAAANGANVLRVHDVRAAVRALGMYDAIRKGG